MSSERPLQKVAVPGIAHDRAIGNLRVWQSAGLEWLREGYVRACARFQAAEDSRREAKETFIPLFEALNWAASIELYMKERRHQSLEDDLVHAIGFARNRVHHDWAAALEPNETPAPPGRGVFQASGNELAGVFVEWLWKPLDGLPEPASRHADPKGEAAYAKLLAGNVVRPTLRDLQQKIDELV